MKQFKINYAYLIYMIEYSQHVQYWSIELGVGFPEHHNMHQCNDPIKEQSLVPHVRASLTKKC